MDKLYYILAAVIGLALGIGITYLFYRLDLNKARAKLVTESKLAGEKAEQAYNEACKNGESRKRELLLQVKEEIQRSRINLERDVRERKADLQRERNRIDQKEEQLERRLGDLSNREEKYETKLAALQDEERRIAEMEETKKLELEKISSLSMEEAKNQVLSLAKDTSIALFN